MACAFPTTGIGVAPGLGVSRWAPALRRRCSVFELLGSVGLSGEVFPQCFFDAALLATSRSPNAIQASSCVGARYG
jgi:hypothetical protein